MALATVQGKEHAQQKLRERREHYKDRERVDNSALPAGSPMYFSCLGCNAPIVVAESYVSKPDMCPECVALSKFGWMI